MENSEAENKTALEAFLRSLAGADFDGFVGVEFYDGIKAEDYMEILLGLQVQFEPEVICEKVQCELQRSITEMGVCYSFNSQLAAYNSPEYREKGMWGFLAERETLEVNPLDGDIFTNIVNISSGSKVLQKNSLYFSLNYPLYSSTFTGRMKLQMWLQKRLS